MFYRSVLCSKAGCVNSATQIEKQKRLNRNNKCWFFFSPGKKKTQEGKNKGKKAADTKQKKADLDSTSADMRDSKEGEFSNIFFFFPF